MSPGARTQLANLARRSLLRTLRQPVNIVTPIVFPLTILAVNVGGLGPAVGIPGFPTDSILDFVLAFTFMQGALFSAINAGTDIARDIETGFLNRLTLTPVRPSALLLGELAGAVAMGGVQGLSYLAVALAAGATVKAGAAGALLLIALSVLMALLFALLGSTMAVRTGSGESVQGIFPLMFVFLFISSAIIPRDLMTTTWFHTAATINPMSYLIEGLRSLIITGWDLQALALCIGIALALATIALAASLAGMRERLAR